MMDKTITFDFDGGKNYYEVILGNSCLTKLASSTSQEVQDFIRDHKFDKSKYVYVLINALGADEYYGPNKNGDGFPEYFEGKPNLVNDGYEHGYKTFQHHAKLYKHHINKDPKKSYGDVLLAIYNWNMHRVELIVRMDREKAPDECAKVERGEMVGTSMGTKVPFDVCSKCGNRAKTRDDYCSHLKNSMNKIEANGKKIYAINPWPKFFDISMVFVPADITSRVMIKIATVETKEAEQKEAEIEKEVPGGKTESTSMDDIFEYLLQKKYTQLAKTEPEIPQDTMCSMLKFPLDKILSTLAISGILPKPKEFQRIILIKINKPELADTLDKQNVVFDENNFDADEDLLRGSFNISKDGFSNDLFKMIEGLMPSRSLWNPMLLDRASGHCKCAAENKEQRADNLIPIMLAVSGLYSLYKAQVPNFILEQLADQLAQHPVFTIGAIGAALGMATGVGKEIFKTKTMSADTQNANELMKISNYIQARLLKHASPQIFQSKGIAKCAGLGLLSIAKPVLNFIGKNYGGFVPSGDSDLGDFARRAMVGAGLGIIGSGAMKVRRAMGRQLDPASEFIANHPGAVMGISALAGHVPAKLISSGLNKTSSVDPVYNPDSDSIKLLFDDGNLLDVATIIQLGKRF